MIYPLLFLIATLAPARVSPEKTTLYIGALLELSNHWYESYVNFFINIIEYVFEEVENRTDILSEYSLKLVTKDTQVGLAMLLSSVTGISPYKQNPDFAPYVRVKM